ncbi:hypothetical protein EGW08_009180 [Elysia chlorotica]|uniref:Uncharacterized protein n=1 Tax=Elysia chlorotica TaxID=188477 RepID=A0A3S1BFY1_ELYCH|nr:hypothetical protein EGW08_009180 [Elysia chlorotica]
MQNLCLGDYPPIPECFSHLISLETEASSPTYHRRIWQEEHHTDATESQSIPCQDDTVDLKDVPDISGSETQLSTEGKSLQGTFQKLNSSLGKLQREMKDLRSLDVSLFYQLIALNEAIQDFKLNASDRFSESGSEYSLGTASYMGSMTSLNDDSDWGEDGTMLSSPLLDGNDTLQAENNSTKELLMQITNLALKADQDF